MHLLIFPVDGSNGKERMSFNAPQKSSPRSSGNFAKFTRGE